jgi:hypothetical protein
MGVVMRACSRLTSLIFMVNSISSSLLGSSAGRAWIGFPSTRLKISLIASMSPSSTRATSASTIATKGWKNWRRRSFRVVLDDFGVLLAGERFALLVGERSHSFPQPPPAQFHVGMMHGVGEARRLLVARAKAPAHRRRHKQA